MGDIWQKEPALIIGAVLTVILNLLGVLTTQGFITEATSGRLGDITTSLGSLIVALLPLITAVVVRQNVYSPASFKTKTPGGGG